MHKRQRVEIYEAPEQYHQDPEDSDDPDPDDKKNPPVSVSNFGIIQRFSHPGLYQEYDEFPPNYRDGDDYASLEQSYPYDPDEPERSFYQPNNNQEMGVYPHNDRTMREYGCRGWGCYDVSRNMFDLPPPLPGQVPPPDPQRPNKPEHTVFRTPRQQLDPLDHGRGPVLSSDPYMDRVDFMNLITANPLQIHNTLNTRGEEREAQGSGNIRGSISLGEE